ncbi:MAG TPA: periplasmic heavy metal sensor [Thermoanaerobaculia bacterium]|nr:periplasmic heavy metal sensor [Thermoanaerobaculia bacterium]
MTPNFRRRRFLPALLGALGLLAVLGAVASNASPTQEAPNRADRPHRGGLADRTADRTAGRFGHGERISRFLVLDSSQSAKVADLVARLRGEVSPIRESHRATRARLEAEMAAPQPDAERIGRLVLEMRSRRGTVRTALERFDQDLSALLRPEQLARYQEWKQRHPRLSGERGRGSQRERRERGGRRGAAGPTNGAGTEGENRSL